MNSDAIHPAQHPALMLPRSLLYVPTVRPELFAKAESGPADALILDLEDAVPPARKDEARGHLRAWLATRASRSPGDGTQLWVRVDPDALEADLDAAVSSATSGVVLAKCDAAQLDATDVRLAALERQRGLAPGSIPVIGLVESGRGLLDLPRMTVVARLLTFGLGEADLLADLCMVRSQRSEAALDALRAQVVVHCAAAGKQAPVAPTSTDFRDLDAFAESTRHLRDLGFRSRTAIHPGQVPVIHEVLAPDETEVGAARDLLERFKAAVGGVTTTADGRLIDAAVVRAAREVLDRAGR